jgi:hypothetical protein
MDGQGEGSDCGGELEEVANNLRDSAAQWRCRGPLAVWRRQISAAVAVFVALSQITAFVARAGLIQLAWQDDKVGGVLV